MLSHDPRCLPAPVPEPSRPAQAHLNLNGDGPNGHAPGTNGDGPTAVPAGPYAVAVTSAGKVLRFSLASLAPISTRKGRSVVRLDSSVADDRVVDVQISTGDEKLCLVTKAARVLVFSITDANVVAGAAKGVTAIKLDPKDRVLGFTLATGKRDGLTVQTNRGGLQSVKASKYPVASRGGRGYGILQRGSLVAVVPDEAVPIPAVEEIEE